MRLWHRRRPRLEWHPGIACPASGSSLGPAGRCVMTHPRRLASGPVWTELMLFRSLLHKSMSYVGSADVRSSTLLHAPASSPGPGCTEAVASDSSTQHLLCQYLTRLQTETIQGTKYAISC
ncbi:hypothetical protein NDU88_010920 [Pleurodeles waltl]|uniref:Uncharacterized protein n=1 Tax=Pleurodeles waltl TaxID=8319 RepID=A0AAV7Q3B7_PLEWA|nr:hypothetical protein NDU88_010920 [Pleurodeles waltl]